MKSYCRIQNALLCVAVAGMLSSPSMMGALITDPVGDFLPSFAGPHNPDLDVVSAQVTFNGTDFLFDATLNGAVGTTPGGVYVWGVNRGAGTARFGALATGVLFDSVVVLQPGGTSSTRDLIGGAATNLSASAITIVGNEITARVSASLLPSQGLQPSQYTVNLWPRSGLTNNNQIADFAPDNSNAPVSTIPEPQTLLLLGPALAGIVLARRRCSQ